MAEGSLSAFLWADCSSRSSFFWKVKRYLHGDSWFVLWKSTAEPWLGDVSGMEPGPQGSSWCLCWSLSSLGTRDGSEP